MDIRKILILFIVLLLLAVLFGFCRILDARTLPPEPGQPAAAGAVETTIPTEMQTLPQTEPEETTRPTEETLPRTEPTVPAPTQKPSGTYQPPAYVPPATDAPATRPPETAPPQTSAPQPDPGNDDWGLGEF